MRYIKYQLIIIIVMINIDFIQYLNVGILFPDGDGCDIYVNTQLEDQHAVSYYGAPADVWVRYRESPGRKNGSYTCPFNNGN